MEAFLASLADPWTVQWVVVPLVVFVARAGIVTIATLHTVYMAKDVLMPAVVLGFVYCFLWIALISALLESADNAVGFTAYAGGYALGTYLGMLLERSIALGQVHMRLEVAEEDFSPVSEALQRLGVSHTVSHTQLRRDASEDTPEYVLHGTVERKRLPGVLRALHQVSPTASCTIIGVMHTEPARPPLKY
ncbi:hypothetical protein H6771_00905 [Candidatus Peribacteria bacterium]|nr:hypothetical protein [Candidatus Peribacteria bacterium]